MRWTERPIRDTKLRDKKKKIMIIIKSLTQTKSDAD